jgi:hypothetical protein
VTHAYMQTGMDMFWQCIYMAYCIISSSFLDHNPLCPVRMVFPPPRELPGEGKIGSG